MDSAQMVRAAVIANAAAHPNNAVWIDLMRQYVTSDTKLVLEQQRASENIQIASKLFDSKGFERFLTSQACNILTRDAMKNENDNNMLLFIERITKPSFSVPGLSNPFPTTSAPLVTVPAITTQPPHVFRLYMSPKNVFVVEIALGKTPVLPIKITGLAVPLAAVELLIQLVDDVDLLNTTETKQENTPVIIAPLGISQKGSDQQSVMLFIDVFAARASWPTVLPVFLQPTVKKLDISIFKEMDK